MTYHQEQSKDNFNFQKIVVLAGILLFAIKLFAWYLTKSVAIYSDALESIVNIVSAFLGLYSLYLVTRPRDRNHPYGHGKVEFLSAGIEGVLIGVAGVTIIIEACQNLFEKTEVRSLDNGIYLLLATTILNALLGLFAIRRGKKSSSIALVSTGHHLLTDTYSTIGIIIGLGVLYWTKIGWIDSGIALIFSLIILYTSYKIIRKSIGGIMDEADETVLHEILAVLNENRSRKWIDLHNVRLIKYGSKLHLDLHMTLPFYYSVREAHTELEHVDKLLNEYFKDRVELFIHVDPCITNSCKICSLSDCKERTYPFERQISWNLENISANSKHQINS